MTLVIAIDNWYEKYVLGGGGGGGGGGCDSVAIANTPSSEVDGCFFLQGEITGYIA